MATSAMSIHTPSGNRNAESVNTHIKIHPVAILQSIRLRSLFSRKSRLHAKIWVLNWFEPIKTTYFSPAENIDVVGKYFTINCVTIQFPWSVRLQKSRWWSWMPEGYRESALTWDVFKCFVTLGTKQVGAICVITFRCDG